MLNFFIKKKFYYLMWDKKINLVIKFVYHIVVISNIADKEEHSPEFYTKTA